MVADVPRPELKWSKQAKLGVRIVFVDDEAEALEEFAELFEMLGYRVATYSSPIEARQRVMADEQIEVVITDLRMAELDGLALVRSLRAQLPAERLVGFIILTGLGSSFRPEGIEDVPVLPKPFDLDSLLRLIQARLSA